MPTTQPRIEDDFRQRLADLERCERDGYERIPEDPGEFAGWDAVAVWPEK